MKRNIFGSRTRRASFDTFSAALKGSLKKPYIGVTQGGSSRKNSGARVAATDADRSAQNRKRSQ